MRYTIAVDFDGVLHSYISPWTKPHEIPDPPVEGAIDWLRSMISHFDVVIFSTRCKTWRGRRAIRDWLWKYSGEVYRDSRGMWEDLDPLGGIRLSKTKPPALIYLDDRAVRFTGPDSWPTPDEIHRLWPWNKDKKP